MSGEASARAVQNNSEPYTGHESEKSGSTLLGWLRIWRQVMIAELLHFLNNRRPLRRS